MWQFRFSSSLLVKLNRSVYCQPKSVEQLKNFYLIYPNNFLTYLILFFSSPVVLLYHLYQNTKTIAYPVLTSIYLHEMNDSVLSIKNLIKQLVFLLVLFIFCLQLNFTVSWRNLFTHSYPPNLWTNFCGSCLGCRIPYSFICSSNLPLHLTNFHLQL